MTERMRVDRIDADALAEILDGLPDALSTSYPVVLPFAAVRLRTAAAKRFKNVDNATAVIWKTLMIAEKTFRRRRRAGGARRRRERRSLRQRSAGRETRREDGRRHLIYTC
jgi:hypothetical protein